MSRPWRNECRRADAHMFRCAYTPAHRRYALVTTTKNAEQNEPDVWCTRRAPARQVPQEGSAMRTTDRQRASLVHFRQEQYGVDCRPPHSIRIDRRTTSVGRAMLVRTSRGDLVRRLRERLLPGERLGLSHDQHGCSRRLGTTVTSARASSTSSRYRPRDRHRPPFPGTARSGSHKTAHVASIVDMVSEAAPRGCLGTP